MGYRQGASFSIALSLFSLFAFGSLSFGAGVPDPQARCFRTGHVEHLRELKDHFYLESNEDQILFKPQNSSDSIALYDVKTRKVTRFKTPRLSQAKLLKNGRIAVQVASENGFGTQFLSVFDLEKSKKSRVLIIDPKTGERTVKEGHWIYRDEVVKYHSNFDENFIRVSNAQGVLRLQSRAYRDPMLNRSNSYKNLNVIAKEGKIQVFDDRLIYSAPFSGSSPSASAVISADRSTLIYGVAETSLASPSPSPSNLAGGMGMGSGMGAKPISRIHLVDLKNKKARSLALPASMELYFSTNTISQDGNYLILRKEGGGQIVFDTKAEKELKLEFPLASQAYFDKKGSLCGTISGAETGRIQCRKLATGEVVSQTATFEPPTGTSMGMMSDRPMSVAAHPGKYVLGSNSIWHGDRPSNEFFLSSGDEACVGREEITDCESCARSAPLQDERSSLPSSLEGAYVGLLCSEELNRNKWDALTGARGRVKGNDAYQRALLMRFSKPGGFESKEHLKSLIAMIESRAYEKFPAEFQAALQGILVSENRLYESLMKKHPELAQELPESQVASASCRTPEEERAISVGIRNYLVAQAMRKASPTFDDLRDIDRSLIKRLSKTELEGYLEFLTSRIVVGLGRFDETRDLSPVKTFKFTYRKLQEKFGLPYKDLTDLTYVQSEGELGLKLMGIKPFEGAVQTRGGFYVKEVSREPKSSLRPGKTERELEWRYNKKRYQAAVEIDRNPNLRHLISTAPAPKYDELWADGILHGGVLISSNMGEKERKGLLDEYQSYFKENGFVFQEIKEPVKTLEFLEKSIADSKGTLDYLVKESHSEGDEQALLHMHQKSKILRGIKETGNGKKEVFDIYVPETSSGSVSVDTTSVGEWMKKREAQKGGQLVFLNTSCFSVNDTPLEITSIGSPYFVNIPAKGLIGTFVNHDKNVLRNTVDGLRGGKSYKSIREEIKRDPSASSVIFPDEEDYQPIIDKLGDPVNLKIRLLEIKPNGTSASYPPPENER